MFKLERALVKFLNPRSRAFLFMMTTGKIVGSKKMRVRTVDSDALMFQTVMWQVWRPTSGSTHGSRAAAAWLGR